MVTVMVMVMVMVTVTVMPYNSGPSGKTPERGPASPAPGSIRGERDPHGSVEGWIRQRDVFAHTHKYSGGGHRS